MEHACGSCDCLINVLLYFHSLSFSRWTALWSCSNLFPPSAIPCPRLSLSSNSPYFFGEEWNSFQSGCTHLLPTTKVNLLTPRAQSAERNGDSGVFMFLSCSHTSSTGTRLGFVWRSFQTEGSEKLWSWLRIMRGCCSCSEMFCECRARERVLTPLLFLLFSGSLHPIDSIGCVSQPRVLCAPQKNVLQCALVVLWRTTSPPFQSAGGKQLLCSGCCTEMQLCVGKLIQTVSGTTRERFWGKDGIHIIFFPPAGYTH